MIKRFLPLTLIIFFISLPAQGKEYVVFRKEINNVFLTVTGPKSYIEHNKKIFVDEKKAFRVELDYGELKVKANRVAYDTRQDVVELADGFKGSLEQYQIEGDYFRINPRTGNYAGYDLKFGYLVAYFYGKEFQFYGDKISVDKISASPLYYPVFSLSTDKLEIYPGYSLAHQNVLKLLNVPFYYIPLYLEDRRRKYFELPFPALEVESDIFHGKHGSVHSHYFINSALFGDVSLQLSDVDGGGVQIQQLIRLSDHQQIEFGLLGWQRAPLQANFSYVLHLFDNPRRPEKILTFREQQQLEEEISDLQPRLAFRSDYTVNEEIKRSIVDRYPDVSVTVPMPGRLYDHAYTLTPSIYYGKIKEKKIFPENGNPQDVNRDYNRSKGTLNFTYYLETPHLKPFIKKALLAMDYEHSVYYPGNTDRGRVSGSLTVRRPILSTLGLFYEATLTKLLLDYGQSPFYFEEYGRLKDSGTLDLYLQAPFLIAGNQLIYDFTNWQLFNEIYYLGVKSGSNYAVIQYDRRFQSWKFAFMTKETAF